MTTKVTKIALAAAIAGAVALPASGALAASKTDRAILGAVIGGIAGAALSDGRGEGVALGAVAGAALGAATHNDHDRYSYGYRTSRPYYNNDGRYYRAYDQRYYGQRYYGQGRDYDRYDTRYGYGYDYRR